MRGGLPTECSALHAPNDSRWRSSSAEGQRGPDECDGQLLGGVALADVVGGVQILLAAFRAHPIPVAPVSVSHEVRVLVVYDAHVPIVSS